MKSTNKGKKLILNKQKVASLNSDEMKKLLGGEDKYSLPRVSCLPSLIAAIPD